MNPQRKGKLRCPNCYRQKVFFSARYRVTLAIGEKPVWSRWSEGVNQTHHTSTLQLICRTVCIFFVDLTRLQVIALLSEMEGHGLTPDVICYNAAIKAAAAGAMMTHTRGSRRRGGGSASGSGGGVGGGGGGDKGGGSGSGDGSDGNSASDSDSGGGVDDGGGKGGRGGGGSGGGGGGGGRRRWEIATGLLREMSKKGVTPNEVSYTSAMIACKNDGEPEEALALLREMSLSASEGEEEGGGNSGDIGNGKVVPNVIHYTTVMSAFAERGDGWRKAMGLIKTMEVSFTVPIGMWDRGEGERGGVIHLAFQSVAYRASNLLHFFSHNPIPSHPVPLYPIP